MSGEVLFSFSYGTYGELISIKASDTVSEKEELTLDKLSDKHSVRFLYNGALGVMTDSNGLYYMRARYYDTDIKRFINQDVLRGDITDSQSLNRYSYVQGDPVDYNDPFGLSPKQILGGAAGTAHTVLNVMGVVPGPIGLAADLMNAGIYWLQGDWEMALKYIGFGVSTFFGGKVIGVLANTGKVGRIASGVIIGVIGGAGIYNGGSMAANALIGYLSLGPNATREQKAEYVSRIIIGLANVYYGANNFATGVEAVHNAVREPLPEIENPDGRETVYNRPDDNVRGPEALPQKDKIPPTDNLIICGSNCFVEGTKIAAADGLKNIEDIEEGDEVYSYDPETGRSGLKKVTHIFESEKNELTDVTIRKTDIDTSENTVETITSTTTHPYFVKGIGFKYAKDLDVGDRLQLFDGTYAEVICIKTYTLDESVKVYNFEVEDWHTYYVGTESILVHNMCVTKGGSKAIKPYEVTTYDDFRTRSCVGDGLEGHEMWQHSNMKNKGYATTRLSTEASRNNPVIALPHKVHVDVNRQQYLFDGKNQTPFENIINALKHLDDIGGD
ncbi:MAG: hypothetical protein K6E28_02405 [Eubacterium sp.]|nr:hypothetical protein [Eubacterium sp.]